jgi:hypothetical protein
VKEISLLENLCGPNKPLHQEAPDEKEFNGLVRSGNTRLRDALRKELSLESRFDLAYNAGHALSFAALRRKGYRSSNRYIVFQVLEQTLGLKPSVWRILARAHELRNLSEYEGIMRINDALVRDLIDAVELVSKSIQAHLSE